MSFPRALGLGINVDIMKLGSFIHLQSGKLYEIKTTGHTLYELLIFPNGLKPSLARPSLTLREFTAKYGYYESKFFQATESTRCLISHFP